MLKICLIFQAFIWVNATYQTKIVGGRESNPGEFPFAVSFQYRDLARHFCGGTIIKLDFIVSAAHCFKSNPHLLLHNNSAIAVAGDIRISRNASPTRQTRDISRVLAHNNFKHSTYENDIALVKVSKPFHSSRFVTAVSIGGRIPQLNDICTTVGWGLTSETNQGASKSLMVVEVSITDSQSCNQTEFSVFFFPEKEICAKGVEWSMDACRGDSGGPLICNNELIGSVSYGYGCARVGFPGVYTLVPYYKSWINNTIEENKTLKSSKSQFLKKM